MRCQVAERYNTRPLHLGSPAICSTAIPTRHNDDATMTLNLPGFLVRLRLSIVMLCLILAIPLFAPLAQATENASAIRSGPPSVVKSHAGTVSSPPSLVQVSDGRRLARDIAAVVARGELVVAMLGIDTPPFFFEKNGQLTGLEVDLAKSIARELGVSVRFDRSAKTFNEVVDIVATGKADLGISKLSRTLARAQVIRFSSPYLSQGHALLLNRQKFAELAGDAPLSGVVRDYHGSLGVIAKSSFSDYAKRNFPNAAVIEYPNWSDVLKAVEKGEVVAAYRDEFEVKRVLKNDPATALNLRSVTFKDLVDTLGIAVGVDNGTLLAFVNEFLAQRSEKLTIQKVLDYQER